MVPSPLPRFTSIPFSYSLSAPSHHAGPSVHSSGTSVHTPAPSQGQVLAIPETGHSEYDYEPGGGAQPNDWYNEEAPDDGGEEEGGEEEEEDSGKCRFVSISF